MRSIFNSVPTRAICSSTTEAGKRYAPSVIATSSRSNASINLEKTKISAALYARFASRGESDFANRVQSAMRHQFGGHVEKPAAKPGTGD